MAADLFESYEVTLVASIILGVAAFKSVGMNPALGLVFPARRRAIGVVASIAGVYAVKAKEGETNALKPINRGFLTAGIITVIGTLILALGYVKNYAVSSSGAHITNNIGWKCFFAVFIGLILAQVVSRLTEYFTGTHYGPVQEIARAARTGPPPRCCQARLAGSRARCTPSSRSRWPSAPPSALGAATSSCRCIWSRCAAWACSPLQASRVGRHVWSGRRQRRGHRRDVGRVLGEAERIMVSLDAVGNTTKAVTKGFAIGSAVIAAVALFASFIETAAGELLPRAQIDRLLTTSRGVFDVIPINVADPKTFIGLLVGGSIAFMFSSLAIRAVGRTAGVVVQEVRRQFADGKIMAGTKRPDYGPVIDICTQASLRELATRRCSPC